MGQTYDLWDLLSFLWCFSQQKASGSKISSNWSLEPPGPWEGLEGSGGLPGSAGGADLQDRFLRPSALQADPNVLVEFINKHPR